MSIAADLLARVEALGGRAEVREGLVHLTAPEPLPDDLRAALRANKAEIVAALRESQNDISKMTLTKFEKQGTAIQISVSWRPGHCWFVGTEADRDDLAGQGIPPGQIWTVTELRKVLEWPDISEAELKTIADVKIEFEGSIVDVRKCTA